ncbi:MAG: nucleotidyl transferase AbiEii/AbiGii toxin family protein [Saccharofermentans sp.]|nr:nucleotidyl transferase AbiEii/AbiGii toxin family protein [Saccharofermentans sp.]
MIDPNSFSPEHIEKVRGFKKVDKTILERSIYALGLLEALVRVGLPFTFKGGTSMLLLLESPRRLSTDIDIVVKPGTDVESYLEEAAAILPFKYKEKQERKRSGSIVKQHYKFIYDSPAYGREFYILLDILFEDDHYANTVRVPIRNDIVITVPPYLYVTVPTADCLMGDKLTAFAPHTTGIPFGIGKELEIIKQMYDVSCLFEVFKDYDELYSSYIATANTEIAYRGLDITFHDVLEDTIRSSACIASRGLIGDDYPLFLSGIRALSDHVFDRRFTAETAVDLACKVMYIAACLQTDSIINKIDDISSYQDLLITDPEYSKLNKIRKISPEGFAYAYEAIDLLSKT